MNRRREPISRAVGVAALFALAGLVAAALIRRSRRGLQIFRSITVGAPVEAVYDFWSRFENFAACFGHVKDIHRTGNDNEWHWTLANPVGDAVEWDTWVTESIPGKAIAWESAPGSRLRSAGVVQFTESGQNSTRVDIRLLYRPSGPRSARALASAFGSDAERSLDEGLAKLQARFDEDLPSSPDED